MPNWCSNDLEIKGSPKEIKRFRQQGEALTQPKEAGTHAGLIENFFAQFVPIPADIYTGNVGQEEEKKYGKWQLNTKAVVVRSVDIMFVSMLWNFITLILRAKTSVYQKKDIREVGMRRKKS